MFSKDITGSDAFRDMPTSTQNLYFHLGMEADDDGFLGNYKGLMRSVGTGDDDLKILLSKRFLLQINSGVLVVKHWLINNTVRKDRYNETKYLEEKALVFVKENKAYTLDEKSGIPLGNHLATQYRKEEDRRDKRLSTNATSQNQKEGTIEVAVDSDGFPVKPKPEKPVHDESVKRVVKYFFSKASKYISRQLIPSGYAHVAKFIPKVSESDLKAIADDYFERQPSEETATNIYKCFSASAVNKFLATK